MTESQPLEPADAFSELGRIRLGETDLEGVLKQVAELARRTIPGADEVSVTIVGEKDAYTVASTGRLALILDESQYAKGHGPCLDASVTYSTFSLPDMATEQRWPELAARALDVGVHSSLSIGFPLHEQVAGAINIYATDTEAFGEDAVALGQSFAGYAAVALTNAHRYQTQATLAQHMQAAMESRAVIEQAKGIIMGGRRCTADEAFAMLIKLSQDTNRKLRDVAAALVDRAASPSGDR